MSDSATVLRWAVSKTLRSQADRYMDEHPHACFAHNAPWRRTIWECYRIPTPTLTALRAGRVVGAAPFSLLWNPFAGPYAVIGPFASYANVLADDDAIASELLRRAAGDLAKLGIQHLRVRSTTPPASVAPLAERCTPNRFIHPRVDTRVGEQALWNDALEVRARNAVRKARKLGVQVSQVRELRDFMQVIDAGNRRLGSPFHGARYFELLRAHHGERLEMLIATVSGRPAAVAVNLVDRGGLYYVYGQNVAELRSTAANALLIWHMLESACARGLSYVDLGRSEIGSPHQHFKRQWGATDLPMWDQCIAARGETLPDLTPTNPEFSSMQTTWSKLPLSVTRRLGPLLIRGFG